MVKGFTLAHICTLRVSQHRSVSDLHQSLTHRAQFPLLHSGNGNKASNYLKRDDGSDHTLGKIPGLDQVLLWHLILPVSLFRSDIFILLEDSRGAASTSPLRLWGTGHL